uniref:hypothetical protein n=1 Tax=Salmonella sp. s54395 TaxID=3159664 RepID=UPI00397E9412
RPPVEFLFPPHVSPPWGTRTPDYPLFAVVESVFWGIGTLVEGVFAVVESVFWGIGTLVEDSWPATAKFLVAPTTHIASTTAQIQLL